jgi:hypothetical protein
MNFKYFEGLTKVEAKEYLDEFLFFGKGRGIKILEQKLHFTTDINYSVESISPIFKTLLTALKTVPQEPDLTLPEFIRNTESYKQNLFEFDEESKSVVMAGAYYLGESFVRNHEQLSWATGNTKFAQGNMPVVTGFKVKMELAVLLIAENMFGGIISGMCEENSIDVAIETWNSKYF